ncbi:DUF4282 domain-containing protein [Ruania alkalisoli]|uniref:DUF4282 domain-containing protein n=1 Tax=Ruania alkalisoli TaxID=2779775 RepID=A0A7M1SRW2_9MICO|nr:DUF4282 domain-containing protein [Ruania alkalisoli]QOR70296.1 DUF4282 domain-containing protein [Ruania alkalisoli]
MSYTPPPPDPNEQDPAYGQQPPPPGIPSFGASSQQPPAEVPSYGSASQQPPSYGSASQQPQEPGAPAYGAPQPPAPQQPAPQQSAQPGPPQPGTAVPGYGAQQPPAGYGVQQPPAGYGAQQPPAGYGPPPGGGYGQPAYPQAGGGGNGFFGAFFDFSFSKYVTLTFAKVIFIIAIIIAALWWLGAIISGFGAGAIGSMMSDFGGGRNGGGGAILGVLAILFGWIPPALFLISVRIGLEFVAATIKTAQNTSVLAAREESTDD